MAEALDDAGSSKIFGLNCQESFEGVCLCSYCDEYDNAGEKCPYARLIEEKQKGRMIHTCNACREYEDFVMMTDPDQRYLDS